MTKKISRIATATCLAMGVAFIAVLNSPLVHAGSPATTKETAKQPSTPAAAPPAAAQPAAAQPGVPMPDNAKVTLMIQLHVAALGLANLTGNYSVLHALGTPAFQTANTLQGLSDRFAGFRNNGVDISPALVYAPVLIGTPIMEPNNVMRVAGFYPTAPQRIAFELAFQPSNNMWRLADIQVRTLLPNPEPQPAPVADAKSKGGKPTSLAKK